jgi:hypothetical protein
MRGTVGISFACLFASFVLADRPAHAETAGADTTLAGKQKRIADACITFLEEHLPVPKECDRYLTARRALAAAPAASAPKPRIPIPKPLPIEGGMAGASFPVLRQDQYDQVSLAIPELPYQVLQGAAITYSKDQNAKNQSLSVKGLLGYSAYNWTANRRSMGCGTVDDGGGTFLAAYGTGPFAMANGTLNEPITASEKSALRLGWNSDARFCDTPLFQQQEVQIMPYGQTDFRGRAGIVGFDALWEPYYFSDDPIHPGNGIHLGERFDVGAPKAIGY